jgi:hypothetical protein
VGPAAGNADAANGSQAGVVPSDHATGGTGGTAQEEGSSEGEEEQQQHQPAVDMEMEQEVRTALTSVNPWSGYDIEVADEGELIATYSALMESQQHASQTAA